MSLRLKATVALVAAIFGPGFAQAQNLPLDASNPAVKSAIAACRSDISKFCPNIVPGGGRILRCLAANHESVSPVCRDAILTAKTALGR